MKLHSPRFEKALRTQVRQAVRRSPELKREARKTSRFRTQGNYSQLLRPCYGVGLALMAWHVLQSTGRLVSALAVVNLWLLALLCAHVSGLWTRLSTAPELNALAVLPMPAPMIFRWQLQKHFRASLFALLDVVLVFGALAYVQDFAPGQWVAALLVAVLSWMLLLAATVFCVARLPPWPFQLAFSGFFLAGLVLIFGREMVAPIYTAAIDQCAPELNLILPTGWAVSLIQLLPADREWWVLILLLPIASMIWSARGSVARLSGQFHYQEHIFGEAPDLLPEAARAENSAGASAGRPAQLGPTAIEEIIRNRVFLAAPLWPQHGWLEHKLWQWFTPRERALGEFVFPKGLSLMAPWKRIFQSLLFTIATAFALGYVSRSCQLWALAIGLLLTFGQLISKIVNHGRAFQPVGSSGVNIPMYAGFGVGFRELTRLLLKCTLIQAPVVLAFALVAGALIALLLGFPVVPGLIFGFKAGGLLLASRVILVAFAFSSGTNDSSRFRLRGVLLIVLVVAMGLMFAGFGGGGLFVPDPLVAWGLWALALLDAGVFLLVYRWFYHSGRIDLMSFRDGASMRVPKAAMSIRPGEND